MACRLTQQDIDRAVSYHGHMCPGLTLGLRAAEWALEHFGHDDDEDIVCISETDMCAVDAIQALVGCTLGKGNLIYRETGKIAFSFYRRSDGRAARIVSSAVMIGGEKDALRRQLMQKQRDGLALSPEEAEMSRRMREENIERLFSLPFEEIYAVKEPCWELPHRARLMDTVPCACCGEGVMESRARLLHGKTYCPVCFKMLDDR